MTSFHVNLIREVTLICKLKIKNFRGRAHFYESMFYIYLQSNV